MRVPDGSVFGTDLFGLGQQQTSYVTVEVKDSRGRRVEGAGVHFPAFKIVAKTDSIGEVSQVFNVAPGAAVTFSVEKKGYETYESRHTTTSANRFHPVHKVTLVGPTSWVTIVAQDASGRPIPYAEVRLDIVGYRPMDPVWMTTDHRGYTSFKVPAEAGERVSVSVSKDGYWSDYVHATTTSEGGQTITYAELSAKPDDVVRVGTATALVVIMAGIAIWWAISVGKK